MNLTAEHSRFESLLMNSVAPIAPKPETYGLTEKDYIKLKKLSGEMDDSPNKYSMSYTKPSLIERLCPNETCAGVVYALLLTIMFPFLFLACIFVFPYLIPLILLIYVLMIRPLNYIRLHTDSKYKNFLAYKHAMSQYDNAMNQYKMTQRDFWLKLSGVSFERCLADLYKHFGYSATLTPKSGDGGIDIILEKDSKKTIVQCKQHSKPVGPAVVRELYGCLIDSKADLAILACTSGFTKGVYDFVNGKPIELIDVDLILKKQEIVYDSLRNKTLSDYPNI